MRKKQRGSLTIMLALSSVIFLTFCLVLIEGVRNYAIRAKASLAIDLAEFSVLSEYQAELLEHYGVFFLDLDYEQGKECQGILEERAGYYLSVNAEETNTTGIVTGKFCRATDSAGAAFFSQAVELMKVKSGYLLFEKIIDGVGERTEETVDLEKLLQEQQAAADSSLGACVDEEGKPLFQISIPSISFPSLGSLRRAVFGSDDMLSQKSIDLSERIGKRKLETGAGAKASDGLLQNQLFHTYLLKYCSFYGADTQEHWTECLEYQLEYIIAGKNSDRENLENIMWRIFLLRASGNYLFFHQDAQKLQKAEAQAAAIAGITGNAALVKAVRELLLLHEAIEEGIGETRRIYAGEKVPLYENGVFQNVAFGYEEYLCLFLNTVNSTEKRYRCMDVIELETRKKCGYEKLRMDHCTDSFELQWSYEFPSLFLSIPLMDGQNYETTITRKIYYAK